MTILGQWAGHFQAGGSDKVWAAAYVDDGQFLSVWGRRGTTLQSGTKTFANQEAALKEFNAKVKKKRTEGYLPVPFDDPRYGIPSFGAVGSEVGMSSPNLAVAIEQDPTLPVYLASHVTPLSWAQLQECLQQEAYGTQEKINGVRCLVAGDGRDTIITYNRRGIATKYASSAVQALKRLACQFVIDGEQLQGKVEGAYVAFDLLEWQGQDVRSWPYRKRIKTLEEGMKQAGLLTSGGATYAEAMERSALPELALLTPAPSGFPIIDAILACNGEGVIVRTLDAPYEGGNTKHIRKFKFLDDLDAIVIGVNPGKATGSVQLGLVRPADGAVIGVGNVRSGLNDQAIMRIAEMLKRGEQPVLTVTYLPIRTVGIALVEPKTGIQMLRTDKTAAECTTDQFGPEKAALIADAKAITTPAYSLLRPAPACITCQRQYELLVDLYQMIVAAPSDPGARGLFDAAREEYEAHHCQRHAK